MHPILSLGFKILDVHCSLLFLLPISWNDDMVDSDLTMLHENKIIGDGGKIKWEGPRFLGEYEDRVTQSAWITHSGLWPSEEEISSDPGIVIKPLYLGRVRDTALPVA